MPDIEAIAVPIYQPLDAYSHLIDNLPLTGLIDRITLVNTQVDNNTNTLNSAIGTQGTLANRLAQSINDDGTLKTVAIDNALHSIAEHIDSGNYVRMTLDERNKLSFISPNATSFAVNVSTISGIIPFIDTTLNLAGSDSISWLFDGTNLSPDMNLPAAIRHSHYYGLIPVTFDNTNFTTTSIATSYKQGSLRVYVNGVRLNANANVYVPFGQPGTVTWTALTYTEGVATNNIVMAGDFVLSISIGSASIIIDFDVLY